MNEQQERKQLADLQSMRQASRLWGKDVRRDDVREMQSDDKQLNKIDRCQYRMQYEPYSWCDLSDNICLEDSGNPDFDTICENNTTREENNG